MASDEIFGGIGLRIDGNSCVGVWNRLLIARLDPERAVLALRQRFVSNFDVTGHPIKTWGLVGPSGSEDHDSWGGWIQETAPFAERLPFKQKQAGR